jgi:cell surface protein SprA
VLGAVSGIRDIRNASSILKNNYALNPGRDFEKIENARKLSNTEFTVNTKLGYISLNNALNADDILGVAFQYTNTVDGRTYQVGEFSTDGIAAPNALLVKLLKPARVNVRGLTWKLMMKNIYWIGSYQLSEKDFRLDIYHSNFLNGADVRYIPEGAIKGQLLLQVLKLDRLNPQQNPRSDGMFDFVNGITINKENGRIFFPVVEPFGDYLFNRIAGPSSSGDYSNNVLLANKYAFTELYDSTKTAASLILNKNRFKMKGSFQSSSSSEISLNTVNVPQGSVVVTAGGQALVENQDYTVDYQLGRVKIINAGVLASNTPVKVSLESNATFNMQVKNLLGSRFDYKFNNDFSVGGTIMKLTEKPITPKVNFGDEPISNTIWGLDANYKTEAPIITRAIDKLPLLSTKAPSSITAVGEFAQLVPGHSKAVTKAGTSYIDDYEGSYTSLDIKSVLAWSLASVPQGQPDLFPEGNADTNGVASGFNRARLAWYIIDPIFFRNNELTPDHIKNSAQQTNNFTREVLETELFPKKELPSGTPPTLPVLNLAFYPDEKGPYNYDAQAGPFSAGLDATGLLKTPESRWGGIMRKLETTDFEASNVEYIQFWLMDPFDPDNKTPNLTGGDLFFNLGDISEDILRDDEKSFENGLPITDKPFNPTAPDPTDTLSPWGRVPITQSIVNTFNNDQDSRKFQDVGLDGFSSNYEDDFFAAYKAQVEAIVTDPTRKAQLLGDISQDDYRYYRGSAFDAAETSILDRYKFYSNLEGNSTVEQPDGYPISATNLPNVEDINRDNTLLTQEAYYQYRVHLEPTQMVIGQNYITDVVTGTTQINGQNVSVKWYQFKIPVRTPDRKVGEISDFRSIRFMRMFVKNFNEQVILRFGKLDLIRGEWRKYDYDLRYPGEYITDDNFNNTLFNLSAVNVEENSSRTPINYVIPPGVERERNIATTNLALQNEQALSMKVCNLQDGFSKAIFRNVDLDVRQYKKLKMFVHGEATGVEADLKDKDLRVFVRLGKDLDQNYYEYEFPLYVTPWSATDPDAIWPDANRMQIVFEDLQNVKLLRNRLITEGKASFDLPYTQVNDSNSISVKGNPNIADLKTIMIGVRNPKKTTATDLDDGEPKCGEIWVNELRLTDFDEKGGWAVNARVTAKLADLGSVTLSGTKKTPGFGSIEQKMNERSREDLNSYDISSSLELGKFIPEKAGIRIPVFMNFSQTLINPQYDPLDPDIKFNELKDNENVTDSFFNARKKIIQDFTERKGINFTNVKKEKTGANKKAHVYDIENLAFTYAYNEQNRRNINTDFNNTRNYKAAIAYNYSNNPKNVKPFGKIKAFDKPYFKLIKDFNYNTGPSRLSFRTDLDRNYNETSTRNVINGYFDTLPATFTKTFDITRMYDFKYDLTKSLAIDFSATNKGTIDEKPGSMSKDSVGYEERRDTIVRQLKNFGRTTDYRHVVNATYQIPINKIPILNFVTATAKYTGNYNWVGASLALDSLGNTIQNSNTKQLTGNFNMVQLYNRIPYYKRITQGKPKQPAVPKTPVKPLPPGVKPLPDTTKKKEVNIPILEYATRLILSLKRVNLSYSENNGSVLPGYNRKTNLLGMDKNFEGPGVGYILGDVKEFGPDDFGNFATSKGWLDSSSAVNAPFSVTRSINTTGRATFEPIKDLEVELNFSRSQTENNSKYFRYDSLTNAFIERSPQQSGNFSISFLSYKTAFSKDRDQGEIQAYSDVFQNFIDYRAEVSTRLGNEYQSETGIALSDSSGFKEGYGRNSQDVLLYAFLAAYSGNTPGQVETTSFPKIPKPNWSIKYDGLTKIPMMQKYFKTVTISHRYRSTFNIGNYVNNLEFNEYLDTDLPDVNNLDVAGNLINHFQIASVTITEQFAPLINIDMTWTNKLITKLELKRDRTIALAFSNTQITETKGREIIVGAGYRFSNVSIPVPGGGSKKKITSDLNVRSDVSFRYNNTITRKIDEANGTQLNQVTGGQNVISIKNSADYVVNERVNVRLFFDKIITKPQTSQTFETANTNAGISIRFTLQ